MAPYLRRSIRGAWKKDKRCKGKVLPMMKLKENWGGEMQGFQEVFKRMVNANITITPSQTPKSLPIRHI